MVASRTPGGCHRPQTANREHAPASKRGPATSRTSCNQTVQGNRRGCTARGVDTDPGVQYRRDRLAGVQRVEFAGCPWRQTRPPPGLAVEGNGWFRWRPQRQMAYNPGRTFSSRDRGMLTTSRLPAVPSHHHTPKEASQPTVSRSGRGGRDVGGGGRSRWRSPIEPGPLRQRPGLMAMGRSSSWRPRIGFAVPRTGPPQDDILRPVIQGGAGREQRGESYRRCGHDQRASGPTRSTRRPVHPGERVARSQRPGALRSH